MAIANVVLNTKTYTYSSDQAGIITWLETSGGIPTGFSRLTMSLREPNDPTKGSPHRVDLRLRVPIVADESSICNCVGEILRWEDVRISVEIPSSGTTAERTDFALRLKDLLANAQVQSALASLVRPG